jgi:hypothetical protein
LPQAFLLSDWSNSERSGSSGGARTYALSQIKSSCAAITPWAALVAALLPYYPKGDGRGRPPVGLEPMLRMYIAQQCFSLSDEGTE